MINWIIGIMIFGLAGLMIVRNITKMRKGQSCCGCEGCGQKQFCGKASK